ncbi:MAG: laccase domain-containing protein, partial [Verrucomicrobiales bacterium]|nr:laccase domain-containing protein [Verrucomicrobiales bacterium]
SGKKGSQLGIVKKVLLLMNANGVDSGDLVVQLSPCIRPPAYEVDFASWIRRDCLECGVPANSIHDNLECTSQNLEAYYSYRSEMGMTGRMLALIGIEGN